ncbi:hypothetical protein DPMN_034966 [Dreissena polymorpha]|uniref:Uncharacterized protein n=1 Tax=Dreissena polymorpha TaxID=45954 RepID=A0A9D4RLG2_DREPO|nr:hypothetical protein DPMN_034966 [Dreissena polymorpha]
MEVAKEKIMEDVRKLNRSGGSSKEEHSKEWVDKAMERFKLKLKNGDAGMCARYFSASLTLCMVGNLSSAKMSPAEFP